MLACFALPQQAAAQNSIEFSLSGTMYTITIDDAAVTEGTGPALFLITIEPQLAAGLGIFSTVNYTAGTAGLEDLGGNRSGPPLFLPAGESSVTLEVPINDDDIVEDEETFTVSLAIVENRFIQATGTITDDDRGTVSLSPLTLTVAENVLGGNATFTVSLSAAVSTDVVLDVTYAAGMTNPATLADDLGTPPTSVTIDDGELTATIEVPITDDGTVEDDETFTVTIAVNTALMGVTIGTGTATGTITDDDRGTVSLSPPTLTVAENVSGGNASFTVSLSAAASTDVVLDVTYAAGMTNPATLADDLGTPPTSVTIDDGELTATIEVPITDDGTVEDDETFTVTIAVNTAPTRVTIGTGTATGTITDDDRGTVSLSPPTLTVAENVSGGNASFTVSLSAAASTDVVLDVTYAAGMTNPATLADDLGTLPTSVTIDDGELTATIEVPITDDNIVEDDETFDVMIAVNTAPMGVTIGTGVATGTITDNDRGVVSLSPPTLTAAEDATFTYTVSLSARADEAVTVRWTATDGTAAVAEDLQSTTGTVTFLAGTNANQTFTISPVNDTEDEDDETFTVTLGEDIQGGNPLPTDVTIGTDNSSTATITDNDDPPPPPDDAMVSIADAPAVAEEDADSASFRISLDRAVDSDVVLAVAYAAGSAALADLGSDRPTTLTIDEGETEATLAVPIVNDTIVEGDETFTVTVTTATAGVGIGDGVATGTITDSDTATISHQTRKGEVSEGGSSSPLIALSAPVSRPITITWTAIAGDGDTATVEDDLHAPHTGTVTFPANDNTGRNYTIRAVADDLDEPDETFRVTIEATGALPARVTIDPDRDSRAVTILDRDDPPPPPVDDATVNIADAAAVVEGAGNASFTVSLDAAVSGDVVLGVTYGGGPDNPATPADDLGSDRPTTVTIDEGETEATLSVPIVDDDIVEGDETFTVTLAINDAPEGVSIGDGVATGTITDNDDAPPPGDDTTVNIADAAAVVEGAGNASFTVSLDAAVSGDVVLGVSYGGGPDNPATPADDLGSDRPTTVTIDEGETEATLSVPIVDDDIVEGDETFTVTLAVNDAPEGVSIGDGMATGTITDNDDEPPPENATVNIADMTALEDAGTIGFTVSLSRAVDSGVTLAVAYTAGSADPGTDLRTPLPATVTIDEGETRATLAVPVIDDDVVESAETFTVTLSEDPANRLPDDVSIGDGVATGTITDNDEETPELTVSIRIADAAPVAENGIARFTIGLEPQALNSDAVLDVAYAPGPATGDTQPAIPEEDLGSDRPATVTIPADSRSVVLEVPIVDDEVVEGRESFTVTLSAAAEQPDDPETGLPPNFVLLFSRAVATGTIEDDDVAEVSISPAEASVREGETFTFQVRLSQAMGRAVALDIAYTAGTADPATDLGSDRPATVTIPANRTAASFDVLSVDDTIVEDDETFTVTVTGADPPDGVNIAAGVATGTIENDDAAEVSISPAEASVREGETFTFTVRLSQAVGRAVVLDIAYAAVTANPATDLGSDRPATMTVPANRTAASFDVPTVDDTLVEDDETFTVTITGDDLPGGMSIGNAVARGTIENDDAAEVSISPAQASVREGEAFTFTVRLSQAAAAAVTVRWTAAGSGGSPATLSGEGSDLAQDQTVTGTLTFDAGETAKRVFTLATRNDDLGEGDETLTVTIAAEGELPMSVSIVTGTAAGSIIDLASVLIEPRRIGVGAALRRHVKRFDSTTGRVIRSRLTGRGIKTLTASQHHGSGAGAAGGGVGKTHWGVWIDGAYAGFDGNATGRQADIYGGVDYRGGNGGWLIGALIGYELAELDIGEATYDADYIHFGLYAGERLSKRLLVDVAATYGFATPELALGDVSASYDANRFTVRGGVTGDFGLTNGSVTVAPELTAVYSRERLGAFTDSTGENAGRELLELGRFGAGPRLAWRFGPGQLTGAARMQWDFLVLDDGVDGRFSGTAEVELRFDLGGGVGLGFYGDVDGIGITDDFVTYGGRFQFDVGF